ncbi:MAG: DUF2157 domain-containing protein [Woeseiaceae bacterium]|nr:DUF2157 domain-containing protein [Woeseiaceae bacterium]
MSDKQKALEQIVALAASHEISADDISAALEKSATRESGTQQKQTSVLTRVLAYLGGTFVFAGLGVFIAMHWESMNFAARVVITLGSGIAAFILALVALHDERYEKAATPLFLIAAFLQPAGLLVIFEEFYTGNQWELIGMLTTGTMAAQQIATLLKTQRTVLLFTSIVFCVSFLLIFFDWINVDYELVALVMGTSLIMLSVGLEKTQHFTITPLWYFIGACWLLWGVFELVESSPVEVLFLGAASGLVYLSTVVHSRMLLFVATVGMLSYIGYFSAKHFVESIGWPIALMIFGLVLIGMSALAFRISKNYIGSRE